jgi:hypothetical protein
MFKKAFVPPAHPEAPRRFDPRAATASEEAKAYFLPYVEPLRDARTKLEDFFNILLVPQFDEDMLVFTPGFPDLDP